MAKYRIISTMKLWYQLLTHDISLRPRWFVFFFWVSEISASDKNLLLKPECQCCQRIKFHQNISTKYFNKMALTKFDDKAYSCIMNWKCNRAPSGKASKCIFKKRNTTRLFACELNDAQWLLKLCLSYRVSQKEVPDRDKKEQR